MDEELIGRAGGRRRGAFRQLVRYSVAGRAHRPGAPRRCGGAEDAVQAWVDAWRHLPASPSGAPFRPWLLTLVANRCRMAAAPCPADRGAGGGGRGHPGPGRCGCVRHRRRPTRSSWRPGALPPEQQRVVALRYFADLDLAESAPSPASPSARSSPARTAPAPRCTIASLPTPAPARATPVTRVTWWPGSPAGGAREPPRETPGGTRTMTPHPASPLPADDPDAGWRTPAGRTPAWSVTCASTSARFGPDPRPDAVWQRLRPAHSRRAAPRRPRRRSAGPRRACSPARWPLAVARAAVLAVAAVSPLWSRPAPVSAEALLAQARGVGEGGRRRPVLRLQAT